MTQHLRIAIAIATTGRPVVLTETLREVKRQTRAADIVAICPALEEDVDRPALSALDLPIRFCRGDKGASAQRNAILRDLPDVDIVLFLDDDFFLAPDYLAELAALFSAHEDVVLATGVLIADGASGPGYAAAEARAMIAAARRPAKPGFTTVFCGYGCNMAVRWSALRGRDCWFDEELPLYSWAEDVDFSRQAAAFGTVLKADALTGVHLATKHGRTSGVRFGYSQVANPIYLRAKGSYSWRRALGSVGRNLAANGLRALWSEPYIDRRGRLAGNGLAFLDLCRGRLAPERVLDL